MKQFFKFFFASCLGTAVSLAVLSLLALSLLSAAAFRWSSAGADDVRQGSVLRISLAGQVAERSQDDFYDALFSDSALPELGLDDVLAAVASARDDDRVNGIFVDCGALVCGVSSARAVREALLDFRKSGKFVVAYAGVYTQTAYYVASAADSVLLNPAGTLDWRGLLSTQFYYKDLLEKLGVEVEVVKVGKFKSFAESYTNTTISDENRLQIESYLQSVWQTMLADISLSRKIPVASLDALADSVQSFSAAADIKSCGMVDALAYRDEALALVADLAKAENADKLRFVSVSQMAGRQTDAPKRADEIAVVYAVGSIDEAVHASEDGIRSKKMAQTLDKLRKNKNVKAVVLRVNSPGGSAYGAEQIWHSVQQLAQEKPVVVSMGDCAASGGYYISAPADKIFAEPTTLTGSIGIFGIIPNVGGLMEKIGVSSVTLKTNERSDMLSGTRGFTPDERALMQSYVNSGYELFLKRCADGRKMSVSDVAKLAEGRVWTGRQAVENGLVDSLGGLADAVACAAGMCGAENYRVAEYPALDDVLTRLVRTLDGNVQARLLRGRLGESYVHFSAAERALSQGGVQAFLPFYINVK